MTNENTINAASAYGPGSIPKEKFEFVQLDTTIKDERLKTKAVSYFGDAWRRFTRDKSAVVAFALILVLLLFAIIVPIFSHYDVQFRDDYYRHITPRLGIFRSSGFWDGGKTITQNEAGYLYLSAIGQESGQNVIMKVKKEYTDANGEKRYDLRVDTYYQIGYI